MLPTSTSGKPGAAYVPSLAVSAWRVVTRLAIIGRVSEQSRYVETAEAAWRWVLDQVRWDDGPWIPEAVTDPAPTEPAWDRDGTYSGVGGLALVLCEIRLARPWTAEESGLADAIARRISSRISSQVDYSLFDGLVSDIGVLTALERDGAEAAVDRLTALATPDGWPQTHASPPGYLPDARINDVTLGTAGVLLGALWARRFDVEGATRLAEHAVDVLLAEAEPTSAGTNWSFVPPRFETTPRGQMPNFSHGVAGVAAALAVAGAELDRPDLTDAARSGAEHLLSLGDASGEGLLVPRYLPSTINDEDEFTFTWCHGVSGTSLLFAALDHAGVPEVAGRSPSAWRRRCLHSVRTSGLPARLHPGFWDNDGRCCGTAGVADVFLDAWRHGGVEDDLGFAEHLADTLVEHAIREGSHAYWRFTEHRNADPLLPPRVGWMQGAAGIAAVLFRTDRVLREGRTAATVPRMDNWWAAA